ncbi:MAG: Hpt domain-containing protein [Desulfovibrionaceae bacterium]
MRPEENGGGAGTAKVIHLQRALANMRGKVPLLHKIAQAFLEDSPEQLEAVRRGLEARDAAAAAKSAHAMKSSLELLAADRAFGLARGIEAAGKEGNLPLADQLFEEFQLELSRVRRELQRLTGCV